MNGGGIGAATRGLWEALASVTGRGIVWLRGEAVLIVDLESWRGATTLNARLAAVSWPRAGGFGGAALGAALVAGLGISALIAPRGLQAHPPPLPSEADLAATHETVRRLEASVAASRPQAPKSVVETTQ